MTFLSNYVRSEGDPKVISSGPSSRSTADSLAKGLGWFSLALGFTELIAPGRLARTLGLEGKENLIRAYGIREIGSGMLTLSVDSQAGLMSRVAGDGLDIVTLMGAMGENNRKRHNAGAALAMVLGITALDLIATKATNARHSRTAGGPTGRDYSGRTGFPKGVASARGAGVTPPKQISDQRSAPQPA
ncbi:hypothetical protein ACLE20_12045 [Rhizobium sp. YIM 134829]|uniref:hypothetical protein n=1 Tax=Rhizobium sp. YIM 134829 TaxID=3390453 RepID=UPI0039791755